MGDDLKDKERDRSFKRDVFISHVEEDKVIAIALAIGLEKAGYITWYYERDSVPGITYIEQIIEAIAECNAMLLVVSLKSMGSDQMDMEVVEAHENSKPIFAVLSDLKHHEFKSKRKSWCAMLKGNVSIEVSLDNVPNVVKRIVMGLEMRGIKVSSSKEKIESFSLESITLLEKYIKDTKEKEVKEALKKLLEIYKSSPESEITEEKAVKSPPPSDKIQVPKEAEKKKEGIDALADQIRLQEEIKSKLVQEEPAKPPESLKGKIPKEEKDKEEAENVDNLKGKDILVRIGEICVESVNIEDKSDKDLPVRIGKIRIYDQYLESPNNSNKIVKIGKIRVESIKD